MTFRTRSSLLSILALSILGGCSDAESSTPASDESDITGGLALNKAFGDAGVLAASLSVSECQRPEKFIVGEKGDVTLACDFTAPRISATGELESVVRLNYGDDRSMDPVYEIAWMGNGPYDVLNVLGTGQLREYDQGGNNIYVSQGVDVVFSESSPRPGTRLQDRDTCARGVRISAVEPISATKFFVGLSCAESGEDASGAVAPRIVELGARGEQSRPAASLDAPEQGGIYGVVSQASGERWIARKSILERLDANGNIDTSFGSNGHVDLPFEQTVGLVAAPSGQMFVYGTSGENVVVRRVSADGTLDAKFAIEKSIGDAKPIVLANAKGGLALVLATNMFEGSMTIYDAKGAKKSETKKNKLFGATQRTPDTIVIGWQERNTYSFSEFKF